jgi:hypothetical protein
MLLKQKIMMANQAAIAHSLAEKEKKVMSREDEVSTNDESNGESPMLSPQRDLRVRAKWQVIKKIVKMEEENSNVTTGSNYTPEDCKRIRRGSEDSILPKLENESTSASGKQEFKTNPTKNIAINYGKAMVTFATSHISIPYILEAIKDTDIDFQGFILFVKANKNKVKSMSGIMSMLIADDKDETVTAGYKQVFQKVCEVFIKYFSANWIIHSKLAHKMVYLKWRSKMLKRVQNPEIFIQMNGSHSV